MIQGTLRDPQIDPKMDLERLILGPPCPKKGPPGSFQADMQKLATHATKGHGIILIFAEREWKTIVV